MKTAGNPRLAAGSGKTNPTLRNLTENPMVYTASNGETRRMGEIVYVTTRDEVERLDLSRLEATFGIDQPRSELRKLRGRIIFTVDGYDETGEEIYEIPEVRQFYGAAHEAWPCWLFAACLASPSLKVIALAVAQNMSVVKSGDECRCGIPRPDLKKFLVESLPCAGLLLYRAGISRQYGSYYLKCVAHHLGFPLE